MSIEKKTPARAYVFKRLYSFLVEADSIDWDLLRESLESFDETYFSPDDENISLDLKGSNRFYAEHLLGKIAEKGQELESEIRATARPDKKGQNIGPLYLSVLLVGLCELRFSEDVPNQVTINESIELMKQYGTPQGAKFINAILDKLAKAS